MGTDRDDDFVSRGSPQPRTTRSGSEARLPSQSNDRRAIDWTSSQAWPNPWRMASSIRSPDTSMKWLDNAAIARRTPVRPRARAFGGVAVLRGGHWRDRGNQDGAGCGLARVHRDLERKLGTVLAQAAHGLPAGEVSASTGCGGSDRSPWNIGAAPGISRSTLAPCSSSRAKPN